MVLIELMAERFCHDFNDRVVSGTDAEPLMARRTEDGIIVVPVYDGMSMPIVRSNQRPHSFASELPLGESSTK